MRPIASAMSNKYGIRPTVIAGGIISSTAIFASSYATGITYLYISYGLITGLGVGLAYQPSIVILGQYFHKRHALANGFAWCGLSVGIMVFPPLFQTLITYYGWKSAMMIISALNMNIVVSGTLMRPPSDAMNPSSVAEKKIENPEMEVDSLLVENTKQNNPHNWRWFTETTGLHLFCDNPTFVVMCISIFMSGFGYLVAMALYIAKAVSVGIPRINASFLMTIMGVCSIVGRSSHGWLIDLGHLPPMAVFAANLILGGLSLIFVQASSSYILYAVMVGVFGFATGIFMALGAVCLKANVQLKYFSSAMGWYLFHLGLGSLIGPPVAGWMYDKTSNFNLAFSIAGGVMGAAGVLNYIYMCYKKMTSEENRTRLDDKETKVKNIGSSHETSEEVFL
ncbi:monocarboxylate transporter 12-like [Saccoglossus kowalevskii]